MDILRELIKLEVKFVDEVFKRDEKALLAADIGMDAATPSTFGHNNYATPAYILAHLFRLDHADNPYKDDEWCGELAMKLTDRWYDMYKAREDTGEGVHSIEWPPLITALNMELLGDLVEDGRKARWIEYIEAWARLASDRPYGFTSPNHEGWRQFGLFRAGKVLDRPEWCDMAHYLCKQELNYQTSEGFWEEGPGYGPSMKYNHLMLAPMAWMYRLTGDEAIGQASTRLADFMATYTFPDGTTVGTFDGRQSTSVGWFVPVCPGMELVPEGRTLNARTMQLYKDVGCLDDMRLVESSAWYSYFANYFIANAYEYYTEFLPEAEQKEAFSEKAPLKVDTQGVLENHTRTFDGVLEHKGKWVLGLSAQYGIFAHRKPDIYRLERQSRIELWHEDAGLVLGGGHNRHDFPFPYANAILDTGWAGDTDFGLVEQKNQSQRRAYYVTHWNEASVADSAAHLKLVFGHGTILFHIEFPDDSTARIAAEWDVRNLKRLALQIPVIVWDKAELSADGNALGSGFAQTPVKESVNVKGGPFGSDISVTIPNGAPCKMNHPLDILRTYGELHEHEPFEPWFRIAMLSSQWTEPDNTGEAEWGVKIN
jgi:hypothetical protein